MQSVSKLEEYRCGYECWRCIKCLVVSVVRFVRIVRIVRVKVIPRSPCRTRWRWTAIAAHRQRNARPRNKEDPIVVVRREYFRKREVWRDREGRLFFKKRVTHQLRTKSKHVQQSQVDYDSRNNKKVSSGRVNVLVMDTSAAAVSKKKKREGGGGSGERGRGIRKE